MDVNRIDFGEFMTKPGIDGYVMQQAVARAAVANRTAREAIQRMVYGESNGTMVVMLAARAMVALSENLDALQEIERIITDNRKK